VGNLLKISLVTIIMIVGCKAYNQKFEHEISFPLLNYQITNISAFKSGLNTHYWNHFYLPNFRYSIKCKNIILGVENYYDSQSTNNPRPDEGEITNLKIQSYSIILGHEWLRESKLRFQSGLGYTYFDSWVGFYLDYYPQDWEGSVCYEYNPHSLLMWTSVVFDVNKHFSIGTNLRFNPMFHEFKEYEDKFGQCSRAHDHDRLQLFVAQLNIGYKF
jgi:hypothetical protein